VLLTLDLGIRMLRASFKEAERHDTAISTAVVDASGHLFIFAAMEQRRWISVEVSQSKALAGVVFRSDGPFDLPAEVVAGVVASCGRALLPVSSVTTIWNGPELLAGIGCSGADTDEIDRLCAHAARDAAFVEGSPAP
jgi:uncharacterized protein GlcG (DUF336 family)